MEPEKELTYEEMKKNAETLTSEQENQLAGILKPEKKDVWESEFENNPLFRSGGFYPFKNDVKEYIRQNFISKAELADKINRKFNGYGGTLGFTRGDLLDLLTQEK